jgi:hypothetical protein
VKLSTLKHYLILKSTVFITTAVRSSNPALFNLAYLIVWFLDKTCENKYIWSLVSEYLMSTRTPFHFQAKYNILRTCSQSLRAGAKFMAGPFQTLATCFRYQTTLAISTDSISTVKTNSSFHKPRRIFLACLYRIPRKVTKKKGETVSEMPFCLYACVIPLEECLQPENKLDGSFLRNSQ